MQDLVSDRIIELSKKILNKNIDFNQISKLKQSGSYREYYRIKTDKKNIIAVFNPDRKENDAFVSFSKTFLEAGLNVPQIFAYYPEDKIYFLEDLGDITFYDYLITNPPEQEKFKYYKKILDSLILFQFEGGKKIDYSLCVPKDKFDIEAILWDLNYFKYFVLKYGRITFDEYALERDFLKFATYLERAGLENFLYRDFQSKNIMLKNNEPYFIDYQGGRKGSFYYDLVSLLYDNKAKLDDNLRKELKEYYYSLLQKRKNITQKEFDNYYYAFALIRQLQALAAYSFRGLIEKKIAFIQSIPLAFKTIKKILDNLDFIDLPELKKSIEILITNSYISKHFEALTKINLRINSFSFLQQGYPADEKGNGGGFVFDCRFLPNPGRLEKYKNMTGLDLSVKEYLEASAEVENFIGKAIDIIVEACRSYEQKGYPDLQINFGCTGGQHRSVYCAEKTAQLLKQIWKINVKVKHLNLK